MVRKLRWVFYALGFMLVLLVGAYAAGQYYRPVILAKINAELKSKVNGDVQIGGLDFTIFERFPHISISLEDIYLRGPQYDLYHKDFLTAERIYVHIDPISILRGTINLNSISIRKGSIFIFRDSKGYSNMDVIKKQKADTVKKSGGGATIELQNILFEDTRFTYVDTLKHKSYDVTFEHTTAVISASDSSKIVVLDGDMFFGGITFNTEKGGYMVTKRTNATLNLEIIPANQRLVVHSSVLRLPQFDVGLSGQFDFLAPGKFALMITANGLDYNEGRSLVPRVLSEKLSKFQFDSPIDLSVNLLGKLAAGDEPKVDVAFTTPKNNFATGKLVVSDLSFTGSFTNHVDDTKEFNDNNSRIRLDTLSGVLEKVHVKANLTITDLISPNLKVFSRSIITVADFNHETDTSHLKLENGIVYANVEYDGKLDEYLKGPRTEYKGKIRGAIYIKDAAFTMTDQKKTFKKINAQMHFTEKRMNFDKVDFVVNGNTIQLKGSVIGFIPFFLSPEKRGLIDVSLYSPRLDLATLKTERKKQKPTPRESSRNRKKISDLVDDLNSKVEFTINLKADEIVNGSLTAKNFIGKISFANDQLIANPLKMDLADGEVDFSLKVSDLDKPVNPVILKAEVKGADIKKFFSAFDNFSQKTIVADNLSGKIYTKLILSAQIDDRFNILMPSLNGEVDFKLREGQLKDFEPLQKMSNFLLKKRDFTDVQFAEIKGIFNISGQYLDVSRMEIQSSVLTLFLEGRYSLGDSTDLNIQVPLSNLKKRDKDYKPENVGVDAKVGASVFLRAHQNKEGKMVIGYNIFKKFKKNKG